MSGLRLIRNPRGTYHFVGRVPAELGFTREDGGKPTKKQIDAAIQCGPELVGLRTRVWVTPQEAIKEAEKLGYSVVQVVD